MDNISNKETNMCDKCRCIADPYDDYGNDDYKTEVKFAPLSEEIVKQLLYHVSAKQFKNLQSRSPNTKCAFIKHNMKDIAVLERRIKFIRAILDNKVDIGKSFKEIEQQMLQVGMCECYTGVLFELKGTDLCEERLLYFTKVIADKRNDINVIGLVQPI